MKKILLLLLLAFSAAGAYSMGADTTKGGRPDFIISANIAGDASLGSLGFDKLFNMKPALSISAKVGFGFNQEFHIFSTESSSGSFILPHHLTCNFGRGRSFMEFGAGAAWVNHNRDNYYMGYPILGYRYHPLKDPGFSFRIWAYYPLAQKNFLDWDIIMMIPFGFSFGIAL